MIAHSSLFLKKIRYLSQALIVSGVLNVSILSLWLYWVLRERPPTPYCELKPASREQQQIPLADFRGGGEVLAQFVDLSFTELIDYLSHTQLVENGYAERDLALAYLVTFHHFDIHRALGQEIYPYQKRLLMWKPKTEQTSVPLILYPGLTEQQFNLLIQFVKKERWPLTSEGMFLLLKKQSVQAQLDPDLVETFMLTPEFALAEWLFNRPEPQVEKSQILATLLEADWDLLKQFVGQQKQLHDPSHARRQKFLLDYVKAKSPSAAMILLQTEWDFAVKKLDDRQAIEVLQLIPVTSPEGSRFAKEMLLSPRSLNVWKQASRRLYLESKEPMPQRWDYQTALARFAPEKLKTETVSTPPSHVVQAPKEKKKPPAPTKQRSYVVQEGDSLWKISRHFKVSVETLKSSNGLQSDAIKPGVVLKIPD
jgi:hypothetical protein